VQPYKQLLKALLILLILDIVVLAAFIWWMDATPDVSIAELLIVPIIFIINVILGLILRYKSIYIITGNAFVCNSVIASLVFHSLFQTWFHYYDRAHFKRSYFDLSGKKYELLLDKRDTSYSMFELGNGSALEFKHGKYEQHQDTVVLGDSTNRLFFFPNYLIGYPKNGDKIRLKDEKN
jgi:hypothetical protein